VSYQEIRQLVEELVGNRMLPTWFFVVVLPVANLLMAALAALASSYFTTRIVLRGRAAEIEAILSEIRRTELVKAAVSNDLWLKQKRWDLRRDVYTRLLEAVDGLDQCVHLMAGAHAAAQAAHDIAGRDYHSERYDVARGDAKEHLTRARRAQALGGVFLDKEARGIVDALSDGWNEGLKNSKQGVVGAFPTLQNLIRQSQDKLTLKARQDLMEAGE